MGEREGLRLPLAQYLGREGQMQCPPPRRAFLVGCKAKHVPACGASPGTTRSAAHGHLGREPAGNTGASQKHKSQTTCGEDEFPSLQSQADLFISKKERRKKTQQTSRPQASSAVGVSAARWCCNLGSPENLFQQIGNVEDAKSSRRLWLLEIPQGRAQAL